VEGETGGHVFETACDKWNCVKYCGIGNKYDTDAVSMFNFSFVFSSHLVKTTLNFHIF
jgi:hypothetical protein